MFFLVQDYTSLLICTVQNDRRAKFIYSPIFRTPSFLFSGGTAAAVVNTSTHPVSLPPSKLRYSETKTKYYSVKMKEQKGGQDDNGWHPNETLAVLR